MPLPDLSREQLVTLLQKHWTKPALPQPMSPVTPEQVEQVAQATFDVMMTRQFRTGPLPQETIQEEILARLRRFIMSGRPIKITLGYAPLKNQKAVSYSRADWAEYFALGHLAAWHNKVQKVYPPGLQIQIVFDDATLRMANHTSSRVMKSYMQSIADLIVAMGYQSIFPRPFAQSRFSWLFHFGVYQWAWWRVRQWERQPGAKEQIDKMDQAALRNLSLKPGLSEQQQAQAVRRASHRYRVYWEALQLVGFTRSRKRLIAMYLDGTQHHIRQTVALHLTTLDKGQVTQPWQGEGILAHNGHGKWEPSVMTANRRQKWRCYRVEELNIIDLPGFESIHLAEAVPEIKTDAQSTVRPVEWAAQLAS